MSSNLAKHQNPNPLQRWLINRYNDQLDTLLALLQPQHLLDVGTGEGFTIKRHPHAVGLDFSHSALRYGQTEFGLPKLTQGDIFNLPFAENSFDCVLCLEVLEHLAEPEQALNNLLTVSKKWVIVSVPWEPLFRGLNFLRGRHWQRLGNHPEHLQNWSITSFREFIGEPIYHGRREPWQIAVTQKECNKR